QPPAARRPRPRRPPRTAHRDRRTRLSVVACTAEDRWVRIPGRPSTARSARGWVVALVVVALAPAGCGSGGPDDGLPARVNALPAGVTGLGPAVFLTRVPDKQRSD